MHMKTLALTLDQHHRIAVYSTRNCGIAESVILPTNITLQTIKTTRRRCIQPVSHSENSKISKVTGSFCLLETSEELWESSQAHYDWCVSGCFFGVLKFRKEGGLGALG